MLQKIFKLLSSLKDSFQNLSPEISQTPDPPKDLQEVTLAQNGFLPFFYPPNPMPGEFFTPWGTRYQVSLLQKELTDDVSERYIANPLADSEDGGRRPRVFPWTFTWGPYMCLPYVIGGTIMVARDDVFSNKN